MIMALSKTPNPMLRALLCDCEGARIDNLITCDALFQMNFDEREGRNTR